MSKKIFFKVNNQKLIGTLFYPPDIKLKNPAILFIHGWTSNETGYAPRAEALSKLGFICLTFNLRGHNGRQENIENFSRENHFMDSISAYDFLSSQKEVDKDLIGVVGASYGAYLGSILSRKRKLRWLVLRAPALYYNEGYKTSTAKLLQNREEHFFQKMKPEKNNLALEGIKDFVGDLLIIESEKDQVIPHQIIKYFINALSDKSKFSHFIIKNANHELTSNRHKQEFIDILKKWFKEKKDPETSSG